MAASKVAAQRALAPKTNLAIPKGGPSPLPKVAATSSSMQVRNDHKSNSGSRGGTSSSEGPRRGS